MAEALSDTANRAAWQTSLLTLGGVALGVAAVVLQFSHGVRLAVSLASLVVLSAAAVLGYRSRHGVQAAKSLTWPVLLALAPAWFLCPALAALFQLTRLEILPRWVGALGLLVGYGLPAALAVHVVRQPPSKVRRLSLGLTASLFSVIITLLLLEIGLRLLTPTANASQKETVTAQKETDASGATPAATQNTPQAAPLTPAPVVSTTPWNKVVGLTAGPDSLPLAWALPPSQEWYQVYSSNERGYFETGNRITYRTNAAGFRDAEFSQPRLPHTLRIALLGDSFTFGAGVKQEHLVATFLEPLLSQKAGCPVEVYNFGVSGYGTQQEAVIFDAKVLAYQPDMLIVWYFHNDVEQQGDEQRKITIKDMAWLWPPLPEVSRLGKTLQARLTGTAFQRQEALYYEPHGTRWQQTAGYMAQMVRSAQTHSVKPLLFVHPTLNYSFQKYPLNALHQQVLDAARNAGFTAYDLLPAFEKQDAVALRVHASDAHPNEIAHRLAAEYAADKIAPALPACQP